MRKANQLKERIEDGKEDGSSALSDYARRGSTETGRLRRGSQPLRYHGTGTVVSRYLDTQLEVESAGEA